MLGLFERQAPKYGVLKVGDFVSAGGTFNYRLSGYSCEGGRDGTHSDDL
jgi:hypothetical protein